MKMRGDGRKAKDPKKTFLRLLGYMKQYTANLIAVLVCIVITAFAQTTGSKNIGSLVDNFILPMVASGSTDFAPLLRYLTGIACIFGCGILASFLQQYLMVTVSQGTQKTIRDEMFAKMQRLPLRYFDSNTAGNIMSRYTSDIDTLRQMISQSIPQTISSAVTVAVILITMICTSWILTLVTLVTVAGIMAITVKVVGKASGYFVGQQRSLGAVNGYVEEMISGQKVVKVFTHEETCKREFDALNEELCRNAYNEYEFHLVTHAINDFCVVELSSFYLDILKDRLYCEEANGLRRRSAQTALFLILDAMAKVFAPILAFTCDEIWQAMPHRSSDDGRNVLLNQMPESFAAYALDDAAMEKWAVIMKLRQDVNGILEKARADKRIGKALEAHVTLQTEDESLKNTCQGVNLAEICIVSAVDWNAPEEGAEVGSGDNFPGLTIGVSEAKGTKCPRCWMHSVLANEEGLCTRCAAVIRKMDLDME